MLKKTADVTFTPAIAGRAARAASNVCTPYAPSGGGGNTDPPTDPPPPTGLVIPAGTPIWLTPLNGDGYASVAPAPNGYTCRQQLMYVYSPGSFVPAAIYYVVCSQS